MNQLILMMLHICLNNMVPNPHTITNLIPWQRDLIFSHAANICKIEASKNICLDIMGKTGVLPIQCQEFDL